ncbi:hypothetical protein TNIN_254021 [Trichonephila inaurata madagascariensis]|uniref:Uncharacterized protein n=1 Tax=Trichonephila inaurata madagascariensis TaxID=2747483 RepID=A0A8X7C3T3_9ARAC|nr:hypothetical protein TNIN_254021 [Trichonephila inaurata madagascariensis]
MDSENDYVKSEFCISQSEEPCSDLSSDNINSESKESEAEDLSSAVKRKPDVISSLSPEEMETYSYCPGYRFGKYPRMKRAMQNDEKMRK